MIVDKNYRRNPISPSVIFRAKAAEYDFRSLKNNKIIPFQKYASGIFRHDDNLDDCASLPGSQIH